MGAAFRQWLLERCEVTDAGHDTPCWLWQGRLNEKGYARDYVPKVFGCATKKARIHRFAYSVLVGPIPDGLVTDHLCCVRHCCNPAHIEPVTVTVNNQRISERGRWGGFGAGGSRARWGITETHCRKGHEFTVANTRVNDKGHRKCRRCHADYMRAYKREHPRADLLKKAA